MTVMMNPAPKVKKLYAESLLSKYLPYVATEMSAQATKVSNARERGERASLVWIYAIMYHSFD